MRLNIAQAGKMRGPFARAFPTLLRLLKMPKNDRTVYVRFIPGVLGRDNPMVGGACRVRPNTNDIEIDIYDWSDSLIHQLVFEKADMLNPLKVFCHEFVHAWQVTTGALRHADGTASYWYGQRVDVKYAEQPWEQQADQLTDRLYDAVR